MIEDDIQGDLPPGIIRSRETTSEATSEKTEVAENVLPRWDKPSGERRITALEPQERHKDRVSIFVDGTFCMGVFADVVATLGLKVGQTVDADRLEAMAEAETRRKAKEDAYRLLSYRARSRKEIADRLQRKGYTEEIVAETLQSLSDYGFVDDTSFAETWVRSRGKTRGKQALAFELRQKGVDRETVRETLSERSNSDEIGTAHTLAVKRVGESPTDTTPQARAKLAAYLARRGFNWEIVRAVLADLYGNVDLDDGFDNAEE
jgi:regulatory protein